jgi:hypothetical protein
VRQALGGLRCNAGRLALVMDEYGGAAALAATLPHSKRLTCWWPTCARSLQAYGKQGSR